MASLFERSGGKIRSMEDHRPRPRLCSLFPGEPEIFHRPKPGAPFGRGETARGKLRDLTREEAEKLGLLSGRYRQTYTCEFLEKQLPDLIARLAE
jgi:hypothetical protein